MIKYEEFIDALSEHCKYIEKQFDAKDKKKASLSIKVIPTNFDNWEKEYLAILFQFKINNFIFRKNQTFYFKNEDEVFIFNDVFNNINEFKEHLKKNIFVNDIYAVLTFLKG